MGSGFDFTAALIVLGITAGIVAVIVLGVLSWSWVTLQLPVDDNGTDDETE